MGDVKNVSSSAVEKTLDFIDKVDIEKLKTLENIMKTVDGFDGFVFVVAGCVFGYLILHMILKNVLLLKKRNDLTISDSQWGMITANSTEIVTLFRTLRDDFDKINEKIIRIDAKLP